MDCNGRDLHGKQAIDALCHLHGHATVRAEWNGEFDGDAHCDSGRSGLGNGCHNGQLGVARLGLPERAAPPGADRV